MAARPGNADIRLVRLRFAAPEPSAALAAIASATGQELSRSLSYESPFEDMYRAERALLDEHRVIPLLHLPEAYALSPRVKDWWPPRSGGWRLADVWLERAP
jgi:ABC-type oligopeptide transport system substrate-binding subunit